MKYLTTLTTYRMYKLLQERKFLQFSEQTKTLFEKKS
jgi:hypothetical protein